MDLDTTPLLADVSSPSLLKVKLANEEGIPCLANDNSKFESTSLSNAAFHNVNGDYMVESSNIGIRSIHESSTLVKSNNFESISLNGFANENHHVDSDFSVDLSKFEDNTCESSAPIPDSTVELSADLNFIESQLHDTTDSCDYLADSTLDSSGYCVTVDSSSIDGNVDSDECLQFSSGQHNETFIEDESSFENLGENVSSTPSEFFPRIILTEQDKAALDEFPFDDSFNETNDIEPHFIVGGFPNYDDRLKDNLGRHQVEHGDMGVENSWNEDFAVPSTSNFPLPLPAPSESANFNDFSGCNNFEEVEPDSYASDLEALFSRNEPDADISDPTAEAGVCGLRNLGNTCFMSTGIQCLAATKSLKQFFMKTFFGQTMDESSLTVQFSELLQKMWSGQFSVVHPTKFKQALGVYYPQFKDCSQHDCQEFLALLLDALHQQLITCPSEVSEGGDCSKFKETMDIGVDYLSSANQQGRNQLNELMNNNNNERSQNWSGSTIFKPNKDINNSQYFDEIQCKPMINRPSSPLNAVEEEATSTTDPNELTEDNEVNGNKFKYINDIFKEAKTSNVNVLVTETEANNEICFDSDKFPKKERRRNLVDVNYDDDAYDKMTNNTPKTSNTDFESDSNFGEYLDLKRIKVNHWNKDKNRLMENANFSNKKMIEKNERKTKVLNVDVESTEKENRMDTEDHEMTTNEVEMKTEDDNVNLSRMSDEDLYAEDLESEKQWTKHVTNNISVVFDSFQGQFKNTVVCSACNFRSITYEPFMYLSVPLPHAIEKQMCVTFISASKEPPVQYLVTLTKQDEVLKIKQELFKLIPEKNKYPIVIAEVFDNHIAKILDDNHQIRYIDDVNRSIYAFEQMCIVPKEKDETEQSAEQVSSKSDNEVVGSTISAACTICLEEKDTDIKRHKDCTCILCDGCFQSYAQHSRDKGIKCPVCRMDLIPEKDLVPIEQSDMKPNMRLLNVPLVYRIDTTGSGNNNQKKVKLFGHPALLKLPNQLSSSELYDAVAMLHPFENPFKLLLVDGQGRHCSRCMFNQHCKGCTLSKDAYLSLRSDDTVAVTFAEDVSEIQEVRHSSMTYQRPHKTLSLYDCVQAFSQSEILDEFNPWYCPRCEKNQCATKTLSVWRFPNYLIVYLKRFVFHECASIKLEDKVIFPLHDFNFNEKKDSSYDLYACVCHTGGVSVGHYIAYTQHPVTNEWHCFNDENVSKQKPQEEEYCNAYILFYKKRCLNGRSNSL